MQRSSGEEDYVGALVSRLQIVARASQKLVLHMVGDSLHVVLSAAVPRLRIEREAILKELEQPTA